MPAKAKKDNTFSARQKHRKIKLINTRKAYKGNTFSGISAGQNKEATA